MPSYTTNDLRSGLKVLIDGDPYSIVDVEFVKPGKGQAFARVKVKNLLSGRVTEKTYKTGENLEAADVVETSMQYLYSDGSHWFFMHPETYEQHEVSQEGVGDAADFLKEQETVSVILWNNHPISVQAPNHVVLKIVETDPGIRGDTATGGTKPAKLETGAVVKVPLFVEEGELIKVDTRSREYLSRAKE